MVSKLKSVSNKAFLDAIFSTAGDDECVAVCTFSNPPDQQKGWPLHDHRSSYAERHLPFNADKPENTFYCISTIKDNNPLTRIASCVIATYVLILDDVGSGPGSKVDPATTPLEPSYKIETSPNNFQYGYIMAEPIENTSYAQVIMKAMSKDHGDTGGTMAAKLVRLPQGVNNKTKYGSPFDVNLTHWRPELRYGIEEIIEAFNLDEKWIESQITEAGAPPEPGSINKDEMYEWLSVCGLVVDNRPTPAGYIQITCPWSAAHSGGDNTAGYSPLGCGGPDYKDTRQFKCQHDHCSDKTIVHLARWMFSQRFVYARHRNVVHDRLRPLQPGMLPATFTVYTASWRYRTPNKQMRYHASEWLNTTKRIEVDAEGFRPDEADLYTDKVSDTEMFNTYIDHRGRFYPETRSTSLLTRILGHIRYLFPDEGDYDRALSFLAWTVHRPEVRIQFALLHVAVHHGVGRGRLKQLMTNMLSGRYMRTASLADFATGQFNEWLYQSLLVVFDEVRQRGVKFTIQDKMRELITETRMLINMKYGMKADADIFANLIFMSNHIDALQIPNEDRRLWVVLHTDTYKDTDYYKELSKDIDDPEALREFFWFLKRHMVSDVSFDPHGRAPDTEAKESMKEESDSEMMATVRNVIEDLKRRGYRCMYRHHLLHILKEEGVIDPARDGNRDRAAISACLRELNVQQGRRETTSTKAQRAGCGIPVKSFVLDFDFVKNQVSRKQEAERCVLKQHLRDVSGSATAGESVASDVPQVSRPDLV
jgi:hypothetical protein